MRHVTAILLAGALAAVAARAQDPAPEEAVRTLEDALKNAGEEGKIAAIDAAGRVPDADVVKLLAKAMRDRSRAVRREAILALGWNTAPEALKELTRNYWKNSALRDDDALFALLLKGIGRHGEPESVAVLKDHPFKNLTLANGTARIMGLGNIRTRESVDALVDASKRGGPGGRKRVVTDDWSQTFGPAFRVAMCVLTGEDLGTARAAWQKWWSDKKDGFEVPAERPAVPEDVAKAFEAYWDTPFGGETKVLAATPGGSPYGWIEEPDRDDAADAVRDLKEAYATKSDDEIIAAIQRNARYNDDGVIRMIAKGLSSRSASVQLAAVDALGWMKNRSALRQLHRLYHRDRSLREREDVFAALFKAIGRHGDKSSLDVLVDAPFKGLTVEVGRARILGVGNIRDKRALEQLVKALRLGGEKRRPKEPVFMEDFRLAFAVLTGVDVGPSREAMDSWWRENRRKFEVAPGRPPLSPALQERWERFWGVPY